MSARDTNERDERLRMAEDILSELGNGYWSAVLDDASHGEPKMGQRVLDYWRRWDQPEGRKGQ